MQTIASAALPFNGRTPEERSLFRSKAAVKRMPTHRRQANNPRPRAPGTVEAEASRTSLAEDAEMFLRSLASGPDDMDGPVAWCQSVASSVHRTSRVQHLKAIACAHAFFLRLDNLTGRELVLQELERAVGRKRSKRIRDLHIVVENFVAYDMGTPAERAAARKLYSRDVRAVEHLRKAKIRPSEVEALAQQKGEGLDRWSRRAAEPRAKQSKATQQSAISPEQEAKERSLRHVLIHLVQQADGTKVRRERSVVTGALNDDIEAALKQFTAVGKKPPSRTT